MCHVYRLVHGDEADPTHETLEVASEVIHGGTRWALPSASFDGLWDSLVYDSTVKRDLLKYSESALLFADFEVSCRSFNYNLTHVRASECISIAVRIQFGEKEDFFHAVRDFCFFTSQFRRIYSVSSKVLKIGSPRT